MSVKKDVEAFSHFNNLSEFTFPSSVQVAFHVYCSSDESLQQIAQLSSYLASTWIVLELFYH